MEQPWGRLFLLLYRNCDATRGGMRPCNLSTNDTALDTWDEIDVFTTTLTNRTRHPPFTKVIEENGKRPFLDCLVSRDNNKLQTNYVTDQRWRQGRTQQQAGSNAPTARLRTLVRLAGTLTRDWHEQSHHCTSSTHKPQPWLGHCPMLKLQYELFSTTDSE